MNDIRAEFERWADNEGYDRLKYKDYPDHYSNEQTAAAWKAWQARQGDVAKLKLAEDKVIGLLEIIDSQKQTHDALIKKLAQLKQKEVI